MTARIAKRIIIAFVITAVIFGLVWFFNSLVTEPPEASCEDAIENQGEEGIDCGGPCSKACEIRPEAALEVEFTQVLSIDQKIFAAVTKVKNPNKDFGVKRFTYEIQFFSGDKLIRSQIGESFIYPDAERYVIEPRIELEGSPDRAEFLIHDIIWARLENYSAPPEFLIRDRLYKKIIPPEENRFSEFSGVLKNTSHFDFDAITVSVLLLTEEREIIGVGDIELKTMHTDEERFLKIIWPAPLQKEVSHILVFVETNIFLENNYIKEHGTLETFQQYLR